MIDTSKIKNKAIVTVLKNGEHIKCKVVETTHITCTIELPDGSHQELAKHFVLNVEDESPKATAHSREV